MKQEIKLEFCDGGQVLLTVGGQCTVCSCLSEAQKILEEAEKNEDQT